MNASDLPPDPRVEHAHQVLAGYDKGKWTTETNLIGHLAGAVRQLLTLIEDFEDEPGMRGRSHVAFGDGGVWITPADAEVFGQSLSDAIAYRRPGSCSECEAEFGGLCYKP